MNNAIPDVPVDRLANMQQSASRISKWMQCQRLAGWEYFAGYDPGPKPSADFGKAVHKVLETINPDDTPDMTTREGRVAVEAMPHLRSLAHLYPIDREPSFAFSAFGRHWGGYMDLRTQSLEILYDWKTTSSIAKWAKNEIELLHDPQAMVYANFAFAKNPSLTEVWLRWVYLETSADPWSQVVELKVDRAHAMLAMVALESYAQEMQAAANACPPTSDPIAVHKYVLTLSPNWGQCEAYRGCPHKGRCNAPPFGPKGEKAMTLMNRMDELLKKFGGQNPYAGEAPAATAATAAAAITPPAAPPMAPPAPPTMGNVMQRLAAAKAVEDQGKTLPMAAPPGYQPIAEQALGMRPRNDPYAPPGTPAPSLQADGVNPPKRGRGRPRKNDCVVIVPPPVEGPKTEPCMPTAGAMAPVVIPPVAPVPQIVQQHPQDPVPETPAPEEPRATEDAPATAGTFLIDTLLVGCMVRGSIEAAVTDFDRLVADAKTLIGPRDYRLYKFGGGNGLLLDAFLRVVQAKGRIGLVCVVDPRTPEATLCLSYLRGASKNIVESVRQ